MAEQRFAYRSNPEVERPRPPRRDRRRSRRALIWLAIVATLLVAVPAIGFSVARATDSPSFCNSACHEMQPYHAAWTAGAHKDVACVECHVEPGTVARLEHKFVALQELTLHLTGSPKFPLATRTTVPDSRCIRCHANVRFVRNGFSHAKHAAKKSCQTCHATAGHEVTAVALRQAGVWSGSQPATSAAGKLLLASNDTSRCGACHDKSDFVELHRTRTDCTSCHSRPAKHRDGVCSRCHRAGVDWKFVHPLGTIDCAECHQKPAKHVAASQPCTTCHTQPGVTWKFTHPGSSATCTTCHTRPAGHRSGTCSTCHQTGISWKFTHPGSSANCQSCHQRPSGHRSGACSTCHEPGSSWRFRHTSSSACSSCHQPPGNHFGTQCASCHSPSRSWASASFSHPGIPGGEHSYRSFACVNCHPGGYSSHTCAKCHGSSSGPSGD